MATVRAIMWSASRAMTARSTPSRGDRGHPPLRIRSIRARGPAGSSARAVGSEYRAADVLPCATARAMHTSTAVRLARPGSTRPF
jgi:hypothetical protein